MTWNTTLGRIYTMAGIPDAEGMPVDYTQLDERVSRVRGVVDVPVKVAGLRDIVTSKVFAGRRKDAEALPELHRLLDQQDARAVDTPDRPQGAPGRDEGPGIDA